MAAVSDIDDFLAGRAVAYSGRFCDGPRKFEFEMQQDAFSCLREHVGSVR
jgi:hypothetical protein